MRFDLDPAGEPLKRSTMKSLIILFVLGSVGAAMVGCDSTEKKTEKKTTVKYDNGAVQTTTVEKKQR
jgi:hypothetical protein